MKWSDFEKYLRGEHLSGRRVTVTIERINVEETHPGGKAQQVPVMYFVGKAKGLILTPTNQRILAQMFGDEAQACIGKQIALEAKPMRVAGNDRLPIRIVPAKNGAGDGEVEEPQAEADPGNS